MKKSGCLHDETCHAQRPDFFLGPPPALCPRSHTAAGDAATGTAASGLTDVVEQVGEPGRGGVEGTATGDPLELDEAQLVGALLVLADDA